MMFQIGFTGTSQGMTEKQMLALRDIFIRIERISPSGIEFHHGDCIGADAQAHLIANKFKAYIFIHPPTKDVKQAFMVSCPYNWRNPFVCKARKYLDRNKDIVDESELLIATPKETEEVLRSGTWSTVRYARKLARPINIILPDGSVIEENCNV